MLIQVDKKSFSRLYTNQEEELICFLTCSRCLHTAIAATDNFWLGCTKGQVHLRLHKQRFEKGWKTDIRLGLGFFSTLFSFNALFKVKKKCYFLPEVRKQKKLKLHVWVYKEGWLRAYSVFFNLSFSQQFLNTFVWNTLQWRPNLSQEKYISNLRLWCLLKIFLFQGERERGQKRTTIWKYFISGGFGSY